MIGGLSFRHVPIRLSFMFSHDPGDNTSRTQILDGARCLEHKLSGRLRDWIANIPARLYSREPVLHLHVRFQHPIVAQG